MFRVWTPTKQFSDFITKINLSPIQTLGRLIESLDWQHLFYTDVIMEREVRAAQRCLRLSLMYMRRQDIKNLDALQQSRWISEYYMSLPFDTTKYIIFICIHYKYSKSIKKMNTSVTSNIYYLSPIDFLIFTHFCKWCLELFKLLYQFYCINPHNF